MTVTVSERGEEVAALARIASAAEPYDSNKAPDEIESDIRRTRRRLGATIDAVERRLAPRRVIASATESLFHIREDEREQFAAWLRENMLPLLLIAAVAGCLLLTRGQRPSGDLAASG